MAGGWKLRPDQRMRRCKSAEAVARIADEEGIDLVAYSANPSALTAQRAAIVFSPENLKRKRKRNLYPGPKGY